MNKKEKPMTAAERQRNFRARQKAAGKKRNVIWITGGVSHAGFTETGARSRMEWRDFKSGLDEALQNKDIAFREQTYAELFSFLPGILKRLNRSETITDEMAGISNTVTT